ncbi:MAG TPA: hypothetical protein VHW23_35270 [Kofleriaceae bacterium]|jgi:hypothetical protein|nr:hypothetical protein [Kofleriaceae bacterium]
MVIVELHADHADCSLLAERTVEGDLVVSGYDRSGWLEERIGRRDYEYFYTVKAKHVPRVCGLLGVADDDLLDAVRALLAPYGSRASALWRAWLQANDVAWVFSVG